MAIDIIPEEEKSRHPPAVEEEGTQERLQSLLDEAMKHPGVAEVMKIYGSFKEVSQTHDSFGYFQTPFQHDSVSTSANPVLS